MNYTNLVAKHNDIGKLGEQIAKRFLIYHNFVIIDENTYFGKKEIDIISEKDNIIRLVEVKTVLMGGSISPEDNLSTDKLRNLSFVLHHLAEQGQYTDKRLQVDFLSVEIDERKRKAHCRLVQNIEIPE
jgi:putative endonuclease